MAPTGGVRDPLGTCSSIFNQWLEFDQTSTDTLLGHGKEVIRFFVTLILFSRSPHYKDSKNDLVKKLCADCHFNQWLDFDQTSTDASSGWGKEVIRFW